MNGTSLVTMAGLALYVVMALLAFWGLYSLVLVSRRLAQFTFEDETDEAEFWSRVREPLTQGNVKGALAICREDPRAVPQVVAGVLGDSALSYEESQASASDLLDKAILGDLRRRLAAVYLIVKVLLLVGLLGTVIGLAGVLLAMQSAAPLSPLGDVTVALVTTLIALVVAPVLLLWAGGVRAKIGKLADATSLTVGGFFSEFKLLLSPGNSMGM